MSIRVLVPLDGSDYSKVATDIAVKIVKKMGGIVVGLGVIDLDDIQDSVIGAGIGASYYAERLEEFKINDAIEKVKNFLNDFENVCKKSGVDFEKHSKSGDPVNEILEMGKTSDLVVIGLRTFFHFETSPEPGETLQVLLKESVCPVFAVPKKLENNNKTALIAYDGTIHSAKAMKTFSRFAYASDLVDKVYLLNVNDDIEEANHILNSAEKYLKVHEFKVEKIRKVGRPRDVILEEAIKNNVFVVVMGAYGRSGVSNFFFGHSSLKIIEEDRIPVFVFH